MRDEYLFINVPPKLDKEEHDFFDYNPELRYFDCINTLVKNVGPKVASDVMWAVYLYLDPDSKFFSQQPDFRKKNIEDNFLKIKDFAWDNYDYVLACYPTISMSPAKADYYRIRNLFNRVLDESEGSDIEVAANLLSKLSTIYSGLDKSESRMTVDKKSASEVKGQEQPGKFAKQQK